MKKKILFIVLSLFVTCSVFAKNDIELNVGFDPVSISNHNYFGEKQIFGVGEVLSLGKGVDPYFGLLIGPSVRLAFSNKKEFQIISGFKFYYCGQRNISSGKYTNLELKNDSIFTGYAWGNDLQFKIGADKPMSFIIGTSFSIGQFYSLYIQRPVDKKGIAVSHLQANRDKKQKYYYKDSHSHQLLFFLLRHLQIFL